MIAREALALEGARCVRADTIAAHVPRLTLIHVCRAQRSVRLDVVLGCWYYFPMAAHLSGTLELRPRGASPRARVKTMYGAQAKCCQDSSAMSDTNECVSSPAHQTGGVLSSRSA